MNQSKIKLKITLIALSVICFVCLLFVIGVVEIRYCNVYAKKLDRQEKTIQTLKNEKDYLSSNNYRENSLRDGGDGYAKDGDIVFEIE